MVNEAEGVIYVKLTVKIVNDAVDGQSLVTVTPLFTVPFLNDAVCAQHRIYMVISLPTIPYIHRNIWLRPTPQMGLPTLTAHVINFTLFTVHFEFRFHIALTNCCLMLLITTHAKSPGVHQQLIHTNFPGYPASHLLRVDPLFVLTKVYARTRSHLFHSNSR